MLSKFQWPESYGFIVYGSGPAFVIHVEAGSAADNAGLKPGDRILTIDEQNVSNLSAGIIKFMANNSDYSPPHISVQACCATAVVRVSTDTNRYGFSLFGDMPVFVENVEENGSAYEAGIRQGDSSFRVT
jgi:S1-C subfamily serine protease